MANQGLPGGQTAPPNINSLAAQGIQGAGMGTAQGVGYQPLSVGALSQSELAPYMNRYTQQVVDANQADILRGANIGLDQLGAQAQNAKAFGGSRHGIAMSEMGRGVADMLGQSSAELRQAGFQNAQQMAQQSQLANQQTDLQAQGQRMGAAGQLADISNLGFGMGQTVNRNLSTQGAQQQALQQALFDAAQQQYQGFVNHPAQGLGYVTGALNAKPVGTPNTVTQTKTPGLFDYLTLGANAYTGNAA